MIRTRKSKYALFNRIKEQIRKLGVEAFLCERPGVIMVQLYCTYLKYIPWETLLQIIDLLEMESLHVLGVTKFRRGIILICEKGFREIDDLM